MLGSDGMDSSTQVPTVRSTWVPMALSYHARISMPLPSMDSASIAIPSTESPRVWLPGTWVHSKLGHKEDLQWADRWSNPVGPCLS
jgi:hypothetical protein